MTTIGMAVLQIIPSLRGVSDAIDKGTRGIVITPRIDTSGAGKAGQQAGRDVQAGMDSQANGGLRRFLTFDGARSAGQQAGSEVNAGLQSADIGRGASSTLASNLLSGAEGVGRRLGGLIATGLKTTAVAGGALAAAGIAGALKSGFDRLTAIDDAKFKLQGLGNDAVKVQAIMDNALAAVKGTAFGLDEAATTAASAVAAGIRPGQQLTDYLKLTADTAAIAGTSLADMGSIFNKVQTSGKAFTGDLNQLSDRGLPVFQWLQDEYKVSGEALKGMVESGKVDAETFQRVVAEHIAGASQKMGGSIRGNLANLKAAYSRFGAEIASPILSAAGPLVQAFTGAFDKVTAAIKPYTAALTADLGAWSQGLATKITAWLDNGGVQKIVDWFGRLRDTVASLSTGQGRSSALSSMADSVKQIGPALQNAGPALQGFGDAAKAFGQAVLAVGPETLSNVLVPALQVLAGALKFVADNASVAVPIIATLVGGFVAFRAIGQTVGPIVNLLNGAFRVINAPIILAQTLAIRQQAAAMTQLSVALGVNTAAQAENTVASNAGAASTIRGRIAAVGSAIAQKAVAVATAAWTGAQWLLNAAMDANPIGIVVLAIAGLVAGIIYAYNHSETFRNIVQAAWRGIKIVVSAVWDWISTTLWPGIKAVWNGIAEGAMWLWNNAIKPAWEGIKVGIEAAWAVIKVVFDVWKTEWRLIGESAMWLWNNAIKPAWDGIKTAFGAAWDFASGIFDKFKSGWDTLKSGVTGAADAIKNGVTTAFSGLANIIKAPLKLLGTFLQAIPTEIGPFKIPGAETLHNWGTSLQGLSDGGYTGNVPTDRVAGVVHGDEHVIRSSSRRLIENAYPGLLDFMNNNGKLPMPGYAEGGHVAANDLSQFARGVEGKPYKWGGTNWGDCSGAVSAIANFATGRPPFSSRFATATEGAELAARGFKSGLGPAGSLNIGWFNGGPYGGHTAATLPDGTNFEMGGQRGNGQFGHGAAGASNPEFTDHAYLPPETFAVKAAGTLQLDAGAPTTGTPASSTPAALPSGGSSSGGGSSVAAPSSISGLASFGLSSLGSGLGKTSSGSDLSAFGNAASEAVGGQVKSTLGVFGIGDSPPFLQAASKFISGIKIGDGNGGTLFDGSNLFGGGQSAAPLSAASSLTGSLPPEGDQHGARGGQAPGPTYNIRTATVEDAFLAARRKENERSAATLSRY